MSDLLEHIGISRQSLYNTFGGKERLFRRVLEHYVETRMEPWFAELEAPGADLGSIETYFTGIADVSALPGSVRKGCLMVNTLVELACQGSPAAKDMKRVAARLERALLNALRGAEEAGQLRAHLQLPEAANFLATVAHGLMVACKSGASRKQQEATARLALEAVHR